MGKSKVIIEKPETFVVPFQRPQPVWARISGPTAGPALPLPSDPVSETTDRYSKGGASGEYHSDFNDAMALGIGSLALFAAPQVVIPAALFLTACETGRPSEVSEPTLTGGVVGDSGSLDGPNDAGRRRGEGLVDAMQDSASDSATDVEDTTADEGFAIDTNGDGELDSTPDMIDATFVDTDEDGIPDTSEPPEVDAEPDQTEIPDQTTLPELDAKPEDETVVPDQQTVPDGDDAPDTVPDNAVTPDNGATDEVAVDVPEDATPDVPPDVPPACPDQDGDLVCDDKDNCPTVKNADQAIAKDAKYGTACTPTCSVDPATPKVKMGEEFEYCYLVKGAFLLDCGGILQKEVDPLQGLKECFKTQTFDSGKVGKDCTASGYAQQEVKCPKPEATVTDKPNMPHVIQKVYAPESSIPSGNGCKLPENFYTAKWDAFDPEKDQLECQIPFVDKDSGKTYLFSFPPQPSGPNMSAKIPSDQLPQFARYDWSVSCADTSGKIAKKSATDVFIPIDKDTEVWVPFWEGSGAQVMSYGINKLIGKVEGNPQWVPQKGFVFDGKTRIVFEKTLEFFKIYTIKEGTIIVEAKPSGPQVPLATLVDITSEGSVEVNKWIRIAFDVNTQQQLMFTHCHNNLPNCFSTATPQPMELSLKTYMGVHQPTVGTKMYVDGKEVSSNNGWKANLDLNDDYKPLVIGDWWPGGRVYKGEMRDVKIIRRGPLEPCK